MQSKLMSVFLMLLVIGSLGFFANIKAAPGDFDSTFSQTGMIRDIVGDGGDGYVRATAIQPDGKIISVGTAQYGYLNTCALTRHNTDGSLDAAFGDNGRTFVNVGGTFQCFGMAIQTDGKILIVGNSINNGLTDFAVARLNANGSLDTTFDGDGKVITSILSTNDYGLAVTVQPDGKIVAVGYSDNGGVDNNADGDFTVVRYNSDGSLDSSFDGDGKLTTDIRGSLDHARTVSVQPDGKIVVGGNSKSGLYNDYAIVRYNQDGSFDTTFDNDGKVITSISAENDNINSIAIQPDGKIVAAGQSALNNRWRFAVARYNVDGSLDSTFDGDGLLTTVILGFHDMAHSVAVQPDGKIIAAGISSSGIAYFEGNSTLVRYNSDGSFDTSFNGSGKLTTTDAYIAFSTNVQSDGKIILAGADGNRDFLIIRYNQNGLLDTSFDGDGKAVTEVGSKGSSASAVKIQPDGKIIVAGEGIYDNLPNIVVARYNPDGTPDLTFDGDGKALTHLAAAYNRVQDIAIQPDGKIVVVGYIVGQGGMIVRYNPDGSLDTTFDSDGKMITNVINPTSVKITANNKILLADGLHNGSNSDFGLVRLNSDGSLDMTFDGDGKVLTDFSGFNDSIQSITILADGKIVASGYSSTSSNGDSADFAVARYNADGSLDTSFDGDGKTTVDFFGSYDYSYGVAVQPDGKIVAAGVVYNATYSDFAVVRFNQNGSLDNTFDGDGKVVTVVPNTYDFPDSLEIQPNGKILTAGATSNGSNDNFVFVRYNTDGSLDTSYGVNGRIVYDLNRNDTIRSLTLDRNGRAVIAGESGGLFTVARFIGDFAPSAKAPFDFDGDGKTDIGIFRPTGGEWWINQSSNNQTFAAAFGSSFDRMMPGDYTGDGKADIAFYRPSTGFWYILRSEDFSFYGFPFGASSDLAVAADFDGDGKIDPTVFRPSTAGWYIQKSTGGIDTFTFGSNVDSPVVADYDGDGKADIAITRISGENREWWIRRSSNGQVFSLVFGQSADKAVPGDYTGDGKADIAFWRPSNGTWYILRSEEENSFYGFPFGMNGDQPTPGDYDGDGKFDAAIYRQSNNGWYQLRSTQGFAASTFGASGDRPIPNAFVP